MTESEIRKQIEVECKGCKKAITCFMCTRDKLIEARKTISSQQESLENFILGDKK